VLFEMWEERRDMRAACWGERFACRPVRGFRPPMMRVSASPVCSVPLGMGWAGELHGAGGFRAAGAV
jgi:hypothetical protein